MLFNSNAFIAKQLNFFICFSCSVIVFSIIARIAILFWLAPSEVFTQYLSDLPNTFYYAVRWDLKVLSILLLPAFLTAIIFNWSEFLNKIGHILIKIQAIIISTIIITLTLGNALYWHTYSNPLDVFAFGLFEDDTTEVLKVLWNDYHPIYFTLTLLAINFLIFFGTKKTSQSIQRFIPYFNKWYKNIGINISFLFILLLLARGSFSLFPLSDQTTFASNSHFLNQLAINAPAHLQYAIYKKQKNTFSTSAEQSLKNNGFKTADHASKHLLFKGSKTQFDVPLLFNSKSNYTGQTPNIIFVLMEGWSSQIVFDSKQPDDFLGEFKKHLPKGLMYKNFLSTRRGTLRFLESTLTNTSFFNLSTSLASNYPFKYSNVSTMKNIGLELGFIRGGSRDWYNQGYFWIDQGFDDFWDMSDIMQRYNVDKFSDWGVHDEFTFAFALEQAQNYQNKQAPYFLIVETTTNHPPHVLPIDYVTVDSKSDHFLEKAVNPDNTPLQVNTAQYMTEQLGQFLTELENNQLLENTIVIATGDHTMWGFNQYTQTSDRILSGAVPLYLRLPKTLTPKFNNQNISASHRDIFPTIFELAYPNAQYLKTGFDLFDEQSLHAGWHEKDVWIMGNLVSVDQSKTTYEFDENLNVLTDKKSNSDKMNDYKLHIKSMEALIQWQFKKEFEEFSKNDKSN